MACKFLILLVTVICLINDIECNANSTGTTDPCETHEILASSNRQHTIQENNGICDNSLHEGWYKLEIEGRPAEIPNVCLKNNVCGTQLPLRIDLDGNSMPLSGEVLKAYACTSYDVLGQWDCCVLRQPVKIKNCDDFYVYHLRPTDRCPVAYCAQEIGINPSSEVTRKRGDALNNPEQSSTTTASGMPTTASNNLAETTTDISAYTNVTSVSVATAGQNIAGGVTTESTVSNVTSENSTASSTQIASSTVRDNVSSPENATDLTVATIGGVGSTTEGNNITMSTSVMVETSAINVTTVEAMTTDAETVGPTSKDNGVSSTESTFVNRTQNTTANLECINWVQVRCRDGNTTCYLSPLNNELYIVCADGSGCGALCDSVPDCLDASDENNRDLCPSSPVCSESQQLCSDGSACFTRCDGTVTCNNATAGEDEDGCFPTSTLSSATTNVSFTTETMTINTITPSNNGSSSAVTQSTTVMSVNTEDQTENETTTQQPFSTSQTSFSAITAVENTTVSVNVSVTAADSSVATDRATTESSLTTGVETTEASVTTDGITTDSSAVTGGVATASSLSTDGITTATSVATDVVTTESSVTIDGMTTETSVTTGGDAENVTVSHSTITRLPTSVNVQESSTGFTRSTDVANDLTNITTVVATTQSDTSSTRSESESSMAILTTRSSTNDSSTTSESTTSGSELTESSIVTTVSSAADYTSVGAVSTAGAFTVESVTTSVAESTSSSTPAVTSQSSESIPQTTVITEETSQSSSRATETTTESTSSSIVTTESPSSSQEQTSPEIAPVVTTASSLTTHRMPVTTFSTVSDVSTGPSSTESVQQSSARVTTSSTVLTTEDIVGTSVASTNLAQATSDTVIVTDSRTDSTVRAGEVTSREQATVVSTDGAVRTVTHDVPITSAESDTTLANVKNTSVEFSSVTGPQPTSSAENQTDHKIYVTKEDKKGLFYENFGLFVFLIVAGAVIVGVCMFGIIGYTYQRRLRTWNPTMAYQDAYGDLEKTTLSFGRDKHGIDSPIPDFDILRDEKKFEETSLSQASTLAVGPTPGRVEPPFDDTYDEAFPGKITNGTPTSGASQQDNGVSYITNGHTNDGFAEDNNVDGIVPVDDVDTSPPRILFPWIENAADTKL